MPASRRVYVHHRCSTPLAIRTRFEWTFFGLGLFAATNLLLLGAYLLSEALRDPLDASGMAIVTAGFLLALASFLLTYIVWPRAKSVLAREQTLDRQKVTVRGPVLNAYEPGAHAPLHTKGPATDARQLPGPM